MGYIGIMEKNMETDIISGLLEGPLIGTLVAYGGLYGDYLGIEGLYNDHIRVIYDNGIKGP